MPPRGVLLLLLGFVAIPALRADERPAGAAPAKVSAETIPDALHRYVARPEEVYGWKVVEEQEITGTKIHRLELTSQTWQGIVWKHALIVYEPPKVLYPKHMLLFVTGGKTGGVPKEGDLAMGIHLARLCGARVATLHQVPNQPLLGDHVEDDLITETWLKYLETGDDSWPLLFPMVKSAVKAMDALQAFTTKEGQAGGGVENFVITGASKRGWTSWLTPVADKRVIATAPIVIDMLNFRAQMRHQLDLWGKFSEQINDYTSKGLVKGPDQPESDRETRLRTMMDPWTYRQTLALPKLLVVGTNDPYWAVDAMSIYINDLVGPRYVLAAPNVGHNLGDRKDFAMTTIGVFFRSCVSGRPLPKLAWTSKGEGATLELDVTCDPAPRQVRRWTTTSPSNDFREAKWTSEPLEFTGGKCRATVSRQGDEKVALFTELEFRLDNITYSLTTPVFRR